MPIVPETDQATLAALRKQHALETVIDRQIAALEQQIQERRVRNQGHEPERREGFDRRARVAPAKT